MPSELLAVEGVGKRFGGIAALADVSFSVRAGRVTGVIGPNGAGKSTLFSIIAGALRPDSGTITFEGQSIVGISPARLVRRGIVRTWQIVRPFKSLSVLENIEAGLVAAGDRRWKAHARVLAEQTGLDRWVRSRPEDVPYAVRRQLEIARALATGPKLLLLDEALAGLSVSEMDGMIRLIERLRDDGMTVLLVEHVLEAVTRLADEVLVLDQGRVLAMGPTQEVLRREDVIAAYLGAGVSAA